MEGDCNAYALIAVNALITRMRMVYCLCDALSQVCLFIKTRRSLAELVGLILAPPNNLFGDSSSTYIGSTSSFSLSLFPL